jgi:predicted dehydrogenase
MGVIGTGFGAKVHVPGFRTIPEVDVVGIAGRDSQRTRDVAQSLNIPRAYDSWEALIKDGDLTGVSIAAPPALHHSMVMAAAGRGLHVLCEKPFGMDPKQASKMLAAASAARVVHMVNFLFRMGPERKRLKELLLAGAIGAIRRVNVEWTLRGRATTAEPKWSWQFDSTAGGGVLFAFGSHVVDYLEWLLGPVRSVSVHLSTRRPVWDETSGRESAEDTVDAIMLLKDGVPVALSISSVVPGGRGHWLSIYGEQGVLAVGNSNLQDVVRGTRLYRAGPEGNTLCEIQVPALAETGLPDGRVSLFGEIARTFVDAIRQGGSGIPNFRDGYRSQAVMDAMRRSHESRGWVDVSE